MMIVAPLLQKGVNVRMPFATNSIDKPEQPDQTVVAVDAMGKVYVNTIEVQVQDMQSRVSDILETKKERIVVIKADEDAPYGKVMEAMDELRAVGIEDMGLITERRTRAGAGGGN
jgi:biopolymer transport protein ExbD